MSGKYTLDAIYITRQSQEKFGGKQLYHVFVDSEKTFDKVTSDEI